MQGAIWKRTGKRGVSYTARVDLGTDPVTGKRRQRAETFRTRKEAEAALAKWVTDIDRGLVVDSANLTVAEYLDKWLGSLEGIEASSKRRYSDLVRLHIKPWV